MISDKKQVGHLIDCMNTLIKAKRIKVGLNSEWLKKFPNEPGVYIFFEKSKLVYAGETKSIKERMKDMLDTRHHTLRRKVGELNFSNVSGYKKATSKKGFPMVIEKIVVGWIIKKMELSFLPIKLGRKELEELIIKKYKPKYNSISKRGSANYV